MYTQQPYQFQDQKEMIAFIKQYSFASIITMKNNIPIASHLPFFINDSNDKIVLGSHFSMANEQARYIEENTSLVIFSEPHAYISPKHYDKVESVPTWDYMAVHAYGKAKIIVDESVKMKALEQMITFYEEDYLHQWKTLPDKYKSGMMRAIVVFELEVTGLQGQKKLSQTKTKEERERMIRYLESSDSCTGKELAAQIKKLR